MTQGGDLEVANLCKRRAVVVAVGDAACTDATKARDCKPGPYSAVRRIGVAFDEVVRKAGFALLQA